MKDVREWVESFCCCIPLRTRACIIGFITLVLSLVGMIHCKNRIHPLKRSHVQELNFNTDTAVIVVMSFLDMIASVLLLVGVKLQHDGIMLPWLTCVGESLLVIFIRGLLFLLFTDMDEGLFSLFLAALFVYPWFVVYTYFHKVKKPREIMF